MNREIFPRMRKKFLFALFLALLLVPILSVREGSEPEEPESYFADGRWTTPLNPDLIVPPTLVSNITVSATSTSVAQGSPEDATIKISILLVLEERFLAYYYPTPNYKINGLLYAGLQIRRASHYFEQQFDVGLLVVGVTSFHADNTNTLSQMLDEAIQEVGFTKGMYYNGYVIEALLVWAFESDSGEAHGVADPDLSACIVRYVAYPFDENVVEHEMSHLCDASDGWKVEGTDYYSYCYYAKCVMSYKLKYVGTWLEDGVEWKINAYARHAHLYNEWCEDSWEEVAAGKDDYIGNDDVCLHRGDC